MANEGHLKRVKKGTEAWNAWCGENPGIQPDLVGANLIAIELRGADLSSANLSGANLSKADLRYANLHMADLTAANLRDARLCHSKSNLARFTAAQLSGADISQANFRLTDFTGADLRNSNFSGSVLISANLNNSRLDGANLDRATMGLTVLASVDLRELQGLETVTHVNDSSISTSTLYRSKGRIPKVFLRGCGLSEWQVLASMLENPALSSEQVIDLTEELTRAKIESPSQVSPIFISYSHSDSDFVDALEHHLNKRQIRFWRDVHNLKAGRLEKQIDRAIKKNPIVLLILSQGSIESDWVEWEIAKARELERKQERDVLCPIALDHSWKKCRWEAPLRRQVEKYNILDFSNWRDKAAMTEAFQKLIDGLGLFYPTADAVDRSRFEF